MTQPSERERKWLRKIATAQRLLPDVDDFDMNFNMDLRVYAALSEVLVKTKEACAEHARHSSCTHQEGRRLRESIRNLEVTGE